MQNIVESGPTSHIFVGCIYALTSGDLKHLSSHERLGRFLQATVEAAAVHLSNSSADKAAKARFKKVISDVAKDFRKTGDCGVGLESLLKRRLKNW